MPLLNKKPFEPKPLAKHLKDTDEVFYCHLTGEAFEDYEEFCERIYLCNSLQWSCSITGKSQLTYRDAIESEKNGQKMLQEFPMELRLPILFLASRTDRTKLRDMADDVFAFSRSRYFIGEIVEVQVKNVWTECIILQVKSPSAAELKKAVASFNTSNDRIFFPPENLFQYEVEEISDGDAGAIHTVNADKVRRKKYVYTRDKNQLFIKQFVENPSPNGKSVWKIKDSVYKQYNLGKVQWSQVFVGTEPKFYTQPVKEETKQTNKKKQQLTLDSFVTKKSSPTKMPSNPSSTNNAKSAKEKADEAEKKRMTVEEIQRKLKEERLQLAEKKKQEKVKLAEFMREYQKKKEDLELEDLKELPSPHPVNMKLPNKYFGQLVHILEFVNIFGKIIDKKRYFSDPKGLTFEILETALSESDVEGPLNDLVQLLLSAVYSMLDLEEDEIEEYKAQNSNQIFIDKSTVESSDPQLNKLQDLATKARCWVKQTQGCPFPKIPVDCFSVSEVLRLHLLCSGGKVDDVTIRWRCEQRGGYRCFDDPGLIFRQKRPDVMEHLAKNSIYELSLDDKLEILQVLIDQVLTYASVRDIIDEKMEKARQSRSEFRLLTFAQSKKEREDIFKLKEEKKTIKEKDKLEEMDKEIAEIVDRNKERLQSEYMRIAIASREAQLVSLGYDRAFRRYWVFKSLPGLYVEHNPQNVGACIPGGTPQIDRMSMPDADTLEYMRRLFEDTNNKENLGNRTLVKDVLSTPVKNFVREGVSNNEQKMKTCIPLTCSGDTSTCEVHGFAQETVWFCFKSEDEITKLIATLNDRGFREHELKEALSQEKERIFKGLPNCPFFIPTEPVDIDKAATEMNKVMDLALRDQLLDLEYKITAGGLGNLKVSDVAKWRKDLEDGNYDESYEKLWPVDEKIPEISDENNEFEVKKDSYSDFTFLEVLDAVFDSNIDVASNVLCSKLALLQLRQSVSPKFLNRPLGLNKPNTRGKHNPSNLALKWEASLHRCMSLSQVFIHVVALEKSIAWSKSLLKTNCKICKTRADPEQMLLCDSCDKGFHTYCLTPKLKKIPEGDWHCQSCKPIAKERKTKKETSKPTNDTVEEEKKTEFGKCKVCLDKVPLIICDSCSQGFHMACLEPPLRKIPRGTWSCHNCRRLSAVTRKDSEEDIEVQRASHRRSARAASSKISRYAQQILSNNDDDSGDERVALMERKRKSRHSVEPVASDLPLDNAVLQELLEKLMHDKDAWPFLRPVTKNEVPDYHKIISHPMDFATIKHKLNMLKYRNNSEVLYDAQLVFDNCFAYNKEDSEIYEAGEKLKKLFDDLCRERHLFFIEEDISNDTRQSKRKKKA